MTYIGDEPEWQTIKYRCPAKHEGCHCPMNALCNEGKSCGKTVHVPGEMDLRRFPAILRLTKTFERLYKGRTAVQRVNARLKVFYSSAKEEGPSISSQWTETMRASKCFNRSYE